MKIDVPPVLDQPGLQLRQLNVRDAAAWYAYLALPEATAQTSWNPRSVVELERLIDGVLAPLPAAPIRFAIVDDADGLLGTIGFHTLSPANRSAEIAYDVAPRHWGRGIATAACRAVTAWGHDHMGFCRIQGTALATNTRSERVLRQCGYQFEGLLRCYRMVRGVPGDFRMFAHIAPAHATAVAAAPGT